MERREFLWSAYSALLLNACGGSPGEASSPAEQQDALSFSFAGVDGEAVDSQRVFGRVTVLLFMTTFDVASQAQARRLEDLTHLHSPRINAVGVFMEAPRYADLVREFGASLGLSFPLAMADRMLLSEHPQLRLVQTVPAWIILDRKGRVVSSAAGALTPDQLDELVREAES